MSHLQLAGGVPPRIGRRVARRRRALVVICAFIVALSLGSGCSQSSTVTNCAAGAVQATYNGRHIDLLSCADVVAGGVTINVDRGDVLSISGFDRTKAEVALSSTSNIVSVNRYKIAALRTGAARISESGWPCSDGRPQCTLLTMIIR